MSKIGSLWIDPFQMNLRASFRANFRSSFWAKNSYGIAAQDSTIVYKAKGHPVPRGTRDSDWRRVWANLAFCRWWTMPTSPTWLAGRKTEELGRGKGRGKEFFRFLFVGGWAGRRRRIRRRCERRWERQKTRRRTRSYTAGRPRPGGRGRTLREEGAKKGRYVNDQLSEN